MLTTACTMTKSNRDEEFDLRLRQQESLNLSHSFLIDIDRCFIDYLMCKGKKNVVQTKCWGAHEQCVINTYRMYERLKKK
jgi:hypothetical protein